jgi:hypothetical protein
MEFARTGVVVTAQRHFRTKFGKCAPHKNCIARWVKQFETTVCLRPGKSPGRPQTSEATVDRIRAVYERSQRKSSTRASVELQVPQPTVWRILRKRLRCKPYKLQLLHALKTFDKCGEFLDELSNCRPQKKLVVLHCPYQDGWTEGGSLPACSLQMHFNIVVRSVPRCCCTQYSV